MTFASFEKPNARKALDELAEAPHLAVFVGAGVSAESGMPPWSLLVRRLLEQASKEVSHFDNDDQRIDWVNRTLASELPAGAAGVAQTLLEEGLSQALKGALYKGENGQFPTKASQFAPGQTAHALAALRVACDASREKTMKMKILTTNYDDLLERALKERNDVDSRRVHPVVWPMPATKRGAHDIKVHHLHGFLPPRGRERGQLTLTDRSFNQKSSTTSARDDKVKEILSTYSCLFLGTSFSDPNMIRYLDEATRLRRGQMEEGGDGERLEHVAIFTHHSRDPEPVLKTRETIARARLEGAMTRVVFLDHYADVAQFVHELREKIVERRYVAITKRARDLLGALLRETVCTASRPKYDAAQKALNQRLGEILQSVTRSIDRDEGTKLAKEPIAAALWLMDKNGETLTPWVTTDRIHRDPSMLQTVPIEPLSRWLSVRAICDGGFLGEAREESRWRFIVGFPLQVDDGGGSRLPIGALTLSTLEPEERTELSQLSLRGALLLRDRLNSAVSDWLISSVKS